MMRMSAKHIRFLSLLLLILFTQSVHATLQNQLKKHPSPYLAMHGEDPVHWQTWGMDVLEKARKENKILYISSGYFACHWCHVMQQESYQNAQIAALLNTNYIPVKVDRELQPALDAHLIDFVQRTRGSAGWPLNAFLTPEGYPLLGLTYAPQDQFQGLLEKLKTIWETRADELKHTAREASGRQTSVSIQSTAESIDPARLHLRLVTMALSMGDEMQGGFGHQNRFPMAPQWQVLLERLEQGPDEQLRELIELTLDQMANQGMRDHLAGGFFRYTVDPGWQTPHYEKMLYSQALLSRLYLQAAKVLQRDDYKTVAKDTLDFTLKVFAGREGGFIASLSAVDPNNVEGGGYLWHAQELQRLLTPEEYAFASRRWRLQATVPPEGGFLPVDAIKPKQLSTALGQSESELKRLEQRVRTKLLQARTARDHPRDEKQLASWNGLMLSALVEGARELKLARYRMAAASLRDYLVNRLWDGKQLLRAREGEEALGRAALEDYVYIAVGLNDWAEFSGSQFDKALAVKLVKEAWGRFYRDDGWQSTDDLLIPGIATNQAISDGPLPSPAALLIGLSLKLDESGLKEKAKGALTLSLAKTSEQPLWYATHLRALINGKADLRTH